MKKYLLLLGCLLFSGCSSYYPAKIMTVESIRGHTSTTVLVSFVEVYSILEIPLMSDIKVGDKVLVKLEKVVK